MVFQLAADPVLGILYAGRTMQLLTMIIFSAFVYVMIRRARAGLPVPAIRKIPGLEAVDEAIGRATEMGRPVHFAPGIGGITNADTFAAWAFLGHIAKLCARYDTRLINTNRDYLVHTINEELIRQSYLEAGRPDSYNPDDVRYLTGSQFGYAAGVLGMMQRERPAANILIGYFFAESMLFAEGGANIGAIQIAGTTNTVQLPFFLAACDYTLLGEEIYAGGAYLSKEPNLIGTVVGQDWGRILTFVVMVIGCALANLAAAQGTAFKNYLLTK
ncbi:MAG: hypothetical protein Q8P31_00450 [Bacillota bacterium]|nr:hypothetical protein [Bacillota bacterium]